MIINPPLELRDGRPVLVLDIDGVVNVFQCTHAREVVLAPYLTTLKLLPGIEDWLARLDRAFSLVWCSHWGSLVNLDAAAAWGLEPRPALEPGPNDAGRLDWKTRAVRRAFAEWGGPLAWVEDGFRPEARDWATQRLAGGARTWLVDVTETGLTEQVTEDLLRWAKQR